MWKQQVLATVDGLSLSSFLDGSNVPPHCLSAADGTLSHNLAFISYKQQDNLLVAWLLASMTTLILIQMVGLTSATQTWKMLNTYFSSHTRAQIKKLKLLLKNPKKDRSISAYVLDIKRVVDALAAFGAPIFVEDHIETILDGLPPDFDPFVASILSRTDPYKS